MNDILQNPIIFNLLNRLKVIWSDKILPVIILVFVILIVLIILGIIKDNYYASHGMFKIIQKTRRLQSAGQSTDYFSNYWVWERNKKKFLISHYRNMNLIPYSRHARKKHYDKTSLMPFRCEVYCNASGN